MRGRAPLAAVAAAALIPACAGSPGATDAERSAGSHIKSDERIVFFPTAARRDRKSGDWVVPIHGWVFEPEKDSSVRDLLIRGIRSHLDVREDAREARILEERLRWFLVDNERGKRIFVRLGGRIHRVGVSGPDGHVRGALRLTASQAKPFLKAGWARYEAVNPRSGDRQFSGEVRFQPPGGRLVVSDIDDTVKVTNVLDHDALVRATFLEPFRAVAGMAPLYRAWAEEGAVFHFVSASPWPLYRPLRELFDDEGFPRAAYHLRPYRLRPSAIHELLSGSKEFKLRALRRLFRTYPERRVVLVGDSGEHDPEIYGALYRRFGSRIEAIYIRDVTDEEAGSARYREAFRDVPAARWRVFRQPAELAND